MVENGGPAPGQLLLQQTLGSALLRDACAPLACCAVLAVGVWDS